MTAIGVSVAFGVLVLLMASILIVSSIAPRLFDVVERRAAARRAEAESLARDKAKAAAIAVSVLLGAPESTDAPAPSLS